jgi:hypothetical protein
VIEFSVTFCFRGCNLSQSLSLYAYHSLRLPKYTAQYLLKAEPHTYILDILNTATRSSSSTQSSEPKAQEHRDRRKSVGNEKFETRKREKGA